LFIEIQGVRVPKKKKERGEIAKCEREMRYGEIKRKLIKD